MPKPNILDLPRPAAFEETRTFVDPAYPGTPLTITIRTRRESVELTETIEMAERFFKDFGPDTVPTQWGGEDLKITKGLCQQICTIMVVDASEEPFDFQDWVRISAGFRDAFTQIFVWVSSVCGKRSAAVSTRAEKVEVPND